MLWRIVAVLSCLCLCLCAASLDAQVSDEEFAGPFASWSNLEKDYGKDGAAVQRALDDVGTKGHSSTLFLPAGTYCVQQLNLAARIGIGIIGENPANTVLKYCGRPDGVLFYVNGVAYSRFSRLTFDCAGVAAIGVDQSYEGAGGYFDTGNEYSDVVFRNCPTAIRGGNRHFGFAETAVLRAHFGPSSGPCIILKNFNALDLWIWYSVFDRCNVGVTNDPGAGNFNVYNSIFRKSARADMSIRNTGAFNIRNNVSVGSKAFWVTSRALSYPAEMTLQGNTMVDVGSPAIVLGNQGPGLLIDNRIRSSPHGSGPVVLADDLKDTDLVTVGNVFSRKNPIATRGRYIGLDDKFEEAGSWKEPVLPGTPPNPHRRVFEVPKDAGSPEIQQAIDAASGSGSTRPVVHIPEGMHVIKGTITVPRGSDVQIIGDGYLATRLEWQGPGAGPVFHLTGPSKAQFREIAISGARAADGIVIDGIDQPEARIHMEQGQFRSASAAGLFVDGIEKANVDLRDTGHAGSTGAAIKVNSGNTNLFSGASANNVLSYDVSGAARLLVRDIWYETSSMLSGFAHLSGGGAFTLHGTRVALPVLRTPPAIELAGFHGSATFLASGLDDRIVSSGDGSGSKVLVLGFLGGPAGANYFVNNTSPMGRAAILNSRDQIAGGSSVSVPDQGAADPAFLREMLAQTRAEQPRVIGKLPPGVSDVRMYRVWVGDVRVGIHLKQ
jgi:hypothetical protein